MSNEDQVKSLVEDLAAGNDAAKRVFGYDRENNRMVVLPAAEAKEKGMLSLKPKNGEFGISQQA